MRRAAAARRRAGRGSSPRSRPGRRWRAVRGPLADCFLSARFDQDRSGHDVFVRGHVGEQVERLEDHADPGALFSQFLRRQCMVGGVGFVVAEVFAVDFQDPRVDRLQAVDAAQDSGFAGAAGSDDAADLAAGDVKVDVFEDCFGSEGLSDSAGENGAVGTHRAIPSGSVRTTFVFRGSLEEEREYFCSSLDCG